MNGRRIGLSHVALLPARRERGRVSQTNARLHRNGGTQPAVLARTTASIGHPFAASGCGYPVRPSRSSGVSVMVQDSSYSGLPLRPRLSSYLLAPANLISCQLIRVPSQRPTKKGAAIAAPSSLRRMRSSLRILLSALTRLLLTTLLPALARFLLLLAGLRLTCATLLTALLATLVLLASALILIHIIFSIAGDPHSPTLRTQIRSQLCDATPPPLHADSLRSPRVS
jgi:hypothetical protein